MLATTCKKCISIDRICRLGVSLKRVSLADLAFVGLLFIVVFTGNAKIFGFPLNVLLPICALLFAPQVRTHAKGWLISIVSASIFFIYAFRLDVAYDAFYPLWIINFIVCYLIVITINERLHKRTEQTLHAAFYVYLVLLMMFATPMILDGDEGRSSFIFGPNILYRVIGFFAIIVVGYLVYKEQVLLAVPMSLLCFYLLLLTGSRGSLLPLVVLVVVFLHCRFKRFSFRSLLYGSIIAASTVVLVGTIDFQSYRAFSFDTLMVDGDLDYHEAYIRYRPYIYMLNEPDRLSMIGIDYQKWLLLFHSEGFLYPHSLILDLIMFYGIFGVVFLAYLITKVVVVLRVMLSTTISPIHIFYYAFFASGAGTLVSGDMGDNGAFMGIIMGMSAGSLNGRLGVQGAATNFYK